MPRTAPPRSSPESPPRKSAPPRARAAPHPHKRAPPSAVPSEAAFLWGLIVDLLRMPLLLVRGVFGDRVALRESVARPAARIYAFVTAARTTAALIALNLAAFLYEVHASRVLSQAEFLRRFTLSAGGLLRGEYLPLLTHVFAHAGPAHLSGNLLTLFVFGRVVERHLGSLWTAGAYVGAAVVSTSLSLCAQVVLHRSIPTLGASGAIAGLVALGTLLSPLALTFEALVPMPLLCLGWLVLLADLSGVASGRRDGIDHFAHLGGYLSALVAYPFLPEALRLRARMGLLLNLATAAGTALLLWAFPPRPAPVKPSAADGARRGGPAPAAAAGAGAAGSPGSARRR